MQGHPGHPGICMPDNRNTPRSSRSSPYARHWVWVSRVCLVSFICFFLWWGYLWAYAENDCWYRFFCFLWPWMVLSQRPHSNKMNLVFFEVGHEAKPIWTAVNFRQRVTILTGARLQDMLKLISLKPNIQQFPSGVRGSKVIHVYGGIKHWCTSAICCIILFSWTRRLFRWMFICESLISVGCTCRALWF